MNKLTFKLFTALLLGWLVYSYCFAVDTTNKTHTTSAMLQKVTPAVVNIKAQIKILDFDTYLRLQRENQLPAPINGDIPDKVSSTASGVIVDDKKGYVL